eukprot:scaffold3319_cov258-Pinguiococcus_pyrenoidosus.AAC.5
MTSTKIDAEIASGLPGRAGGVQGGGHALWLEEEGQEERSGSGESKHEGSKAAGLTSSSSSSSSLSSSPFPENAPDDCGGSGKAPRSDEDPPAGSPEAPRGEASSATQGAVERCHRSWTEGANSGGVGDIAPWISRLGGRSGLALSGPSQDQTGLIAHAVASTAPNKSVQVWLCCPPATPAEEKRLRRASLRLLVPLPWLGRTLSS